jgi:concanavalin A-like lectin/glucanase superfamily protein
VGLPAYLTQVLIDHPVMLWVLSDAQGTTAVDSNPSIVGPKNPGTINGTVTFGVSSPFAGISAALLDGSSGYISAPNLAALFPGASYSLEAMVQASSQGGAVFNEIGVGQGWEDTQVEVQSNGNVKFRTWNSSIITSSGNILDGNWHHLLMTYSRPQTKLAGYVDGSLISSLTTTRAMPTDSHTTDTPPTNVSYNLGQTGATNLGNNVNFKGSVFAAAVYNYALTAAQVSNHYSAWQGAAKEIYVPFPQNFQPWDMAAQNQIAAWFAETYWGGGNGQVPGVGVESVVGVSTSGSVTLKYWIAPGSINPLG